MLPIDTPTDGTTDSEDMDSDDAAPPTPAAPVAPAPPAPAPAPPPRTVHRAPMRKFKCDDCGKLWPSEHALTTHRYTHTRERPYACSATGCSESFSQICNLKSHVRSKHEKDTPKFKCHVCNKYYSSTPNLKKHLEKTHSAVATVYCVVCSTLMRGDLGRHSRTPKHLNRVLKHIREKTAEFEHVQRMFRELLAVNDRQSAAVVIKECIQTTEETLSTLFEEAALATTGLAAAAAAANASRHARR